MTKRGTLSPDKIISAAMALLDREGEKGFSMRKLAGELGVDPMALYHHHRNRDALIHAVLQSLMDGFDIPPSSGDWQQDIRTLCRSLRALARKHPGAFRIYELYEEWVPAEHHVHEAFYATLIRAGFSPRAAVQAVRVLLAYTEAFAVDEITGWMAPYNADDRKAMADSLSPQSHPVTTDLLDEIATPDPEADFTFGLDLLIIGLETKRAT